MARQAQGDLKMTACPNGSGNRPSVPGTTPVIIRFANLRDLALPDLSPYGISPRLAPGGNSIEGFDIDVTELLSSDNLSTYGAIYGPTTADDFCASAPPTEFPGANAGVAALASLAAQSAWDRLCQCNEPPPPNCETYNGLGQCAGVGYSLRCTTIRDQSGGVGEPVLVEYINDVECDPEFVDFGGVYGPLGTAYIEDFAGLTRVVLPCKSLFGADRLVGLSEQSNATIVSFTVSNIVRCDGLPDNCCGDGGGEQPFPEPVDYPDPTFPYNGDDGGGDGDVTIVFVPCCPGPQGEPGEDGEDVTKFNLVQDLFNGTVGQNVRLFKQPGQVVYGVVVSAIAIPIGCSRVPAQGDASALYNLGSVRMYRDGARSPSVIIDSDQFWHTAIEDAIGWEAAEVRGAPGTEFIVQLLIKQEVE